jgi:hypothetical protein
MVRGRINTITRVVLITLTTEARPEELPGDTACTTVALLQHPMGALLLQESLQVATTGAMIMVRLEVVLIGEHLLRTKTTYLHLRIEACHRRIEGREARFERP